MSLRLTRRAGSPFWWITGTVAGRRVRESSGCVKKELAEQKRSARETSLHRAAIHGAPTPKFAFSTVALSYAQHGGPHSADTLAKVDRLLEFFGAGADADDIDQNAIDRACAKLLRPGATPATRLRQIIAPARAVLTHGARRRMCQMPAFDTGRASPGRTEWLTPAQVDALLAAAAPHLRPLLAFLAGTGARLGEALLLEWKDVDLRHGRATLRGELDDGTRGTKSGRDRIVDLCPRVLAALRYDPRPKKRQAAVRAPIGRVFLTRAGRAYAKRRVQGGGQIKTGWAAAKKRAGITSRITPHGLRHTWASWHYAVHRDPILLRNAGGWSTIDLVERYAHLTPPGLAPEIEAWRARETLLAGDTGAAAPQKATA